MIPVYRGQTIPVITIQPNWDSAVRWGQQCTTTITEALDTTEERQARFPRDLYRLDYDTLTLSAAETAYLRRIIETADDQPVACPLWPMACRLTAGAAAGETLLSVDSTADCLFEVFHQHALLWRSFDVWEVVELFVVTDNSVALSVGLSRAYATNAFLLPLAYGHVPRGPVEQITDEHGVWQCSFRETFHGLNDQSRPEGWAGFDPALCSVIGITNGGGDLFDCYSTGFVTTLPLAGTGITAGWIIANSPFPTFFDEEFNDFDPGAFVEQEVTTPGFSGSWRVGDSAFVSALDEGFDSYSDGAFAELSVAAPGFDGSWCVGDGTI